MAGLLERPDATAFLSLGANLGARAHNLARAIVLLALSRRVRLARISPVYETAPWGVTDQPAFLNLAIEVRTSLTPLQLLELCKDVEARVGRTPTRRWGPRVVDIDIVLHGTGTVCTERLTIPHPRAAERQFVLIPLASIAPEATIAPGVRVSALARPADSEVRLLGPLAHVLREERAGASGGQGPGAGG